METDSEQVQPKPLHKFNLDRRSFFKILGGGVAIAFVISDIVVNGFAANEEVLDDNLINAWIHIGENGKITVYTGKVEVGQNIRTSLAQTVAEELNVPVDSIVMMMGDTDLTPYDRGTFGSLTTPRMAPQLRKAAASAREKLLQLAAEAWKEEKAALKAVLGKIESTKSKKSISYSNLVKGKELIDKVDDHVSVTPVEQWKIAGTSVPKVNGSLFVTGMHQYVSDMKFPGMLYGKVLRPVSFGASLVSIDSATAQAMPGVTVVRDGDFVGVTAGDIVTAEKALHTLKAEWKTIPHPSRGEIFDYLVKNSSEGGGGWRGGSHSSGNVEEGLKKAIITADRSFQVDYIAHTPLEPRAALAEWKDGKLTVWTGTQCPFGVQEELTEAFRLPKEKVRVIMPDTGSGYGGKHTGDAALEAARLAKAVQKPVKVVWTREEEFTWAYFRPAGVITVKAGAQKDGTVTAWEFHNYNSGGSGIETPYEIANQQIKFHPVESPLRQGSYRGLAATANTFARESIMYDLADDLKMDQLEFRLKNLQDERLINVLKAAASKFGWKPAAAKGRGFGIACGTEKGSYIATCADITVEAGGNVKINRVVAAFECGAIVNPNHLENQIQGALMQGLGGALFEWIDFKDGKILNPLLSKYRVPRFNDMPQVEVVMLNRKDIPSAGAGETPIFGIAPAIRNAIADATGKRLYTLPLVPNGLKV